MENSMEDIVILKPQHDESHPDNEILESLRELDSLELSMVGGGTISAVFG
jgi:hypothetical protein